MKLLKKLILIFKSEVIHFIEFYTHTHTHTHTRARARAHKMLLLN